MILRQRDFLLVTVSRRLEPLLRNLSDMEIAWAAKGLDGLPIDRPVFVTGLARSGTTMVLTLLSKAQGVATHRYGDFPFVSTPILWNRFRGLSRAAEQPVERPHADRIRITSESPEGFEEPIWQAFFPWTHDPSRCHVLGADVDAPRFEAFFRDHLRKIIWIRGGERYASKANYNVGRLAYLARLFPDARFIVPIREPVAHVHSLVTQHQRFCGYSAEDRRVPRYLAAAGHYEFGPQRRPINLDPARTGWIEQAWSRGDEYRGYARQWAEVYRHVDAVRQTEPSLTQRLRMVRFEDLCRRPTETVAHLMAAAALRDSDGAVQAVAATLSAPPDQRARISEADRRAVWEEAGAVAERFGYGPP